MKLNDCLKGQKVKYVRKKEECSGCRACEQICPIKCITINSDEEGFLYPNIDEEKCIGCKKCIEICNHKCKNILLDEKIAYAVKNIKEDVRKESSSGGVFYELGMEALRCEGQVFGAAFDENYRVHQKGEGTEEGIHSFMGSKYVQSDTGTTYQEVQKLLNEGTYVLYTGTPCQIRGLRQYLREDFENLLCVSLICHGVPSGMVWERYVKLKAGQYAEKKPIKISFRNKTNGWRNMNLKMEFPGYCYKAIHNRDLYFQGFNQNLFLRPSCYQCRAKKELEIADITIGDFWGVENFFPELDDEMGVSCVIIHSVKGLSYWKRIEKKFKIKKCSIKNIIEKNPFLYESVPPNPKRENFFIQLKTTGTVEESIRDNLVLGISKEFRQQHQYEIIKQYLKKKIDKEDVFKFILQCGFHKICLYAVTDLTQLVISDLLQSDEIELLYICDRNSQAYQGGVQGIKVMNQNYLISDILENKIDLIIICNPIRENDIFEELISGGIPKEKIISIVDLVFAGERE